MDKWTIVAKNVAKETTETASMAHTQTGEQKRCYSKPEEWTSEDGVKHNRVVLVANKFYEPTKKEENPAPEAKTSKKKGK